MDSQKNVGTGAPASREALNPPSDSLPPWERQAPAGRVTATNWRAIYPPRNTLVGWVDIIAGSMRLHDCSVHIKNDQKWVGLPSRPVLDRDNKALINPKTNKISYSASVSFETNAAKERFQRAARAAIDALTGQEGPP